MKRTFVPLVLIAATFATTAFADDVLSPKARELRGTAIARSGNDVRLPFEFARGKAPVAANTTVKSAGADRNLVTEERAIVYTGKNPFRNTRSFEIAPVK